jgi:hypothetical protein
MPDGEYTLPCYGNITDCGKCEICAIRSYCRDFAEAERALAVGRSRIVGRPERIPERVPAERPDAEEVLKYTDEDLLRVIRFFLTLSVEEIRIVQLRIGSPEITNEQIAKKLKIDRKRIYEFFRRETEALPELKKLLYRQKKKRE